MRCSITLTIISAVTLTVVQSSSYTGDRTQPDITKSRLYSRDSNHAYALQARSPAPGITSSLLSPKSSPKHGRRKKLKLLAKGNSVPTREASPLALTDAERLATIQRLERDYAFKNMGLPPLRHTQSALGLEVHGRPWSTLRSRRDRSHTTMSKARAEAYERDESNVPGPSRFYPKFSSGPAETMIRYDVLQRNPGEPGYIAPSPFRASRVPERSMISIPDRKPPREYKSGTALRSVNDDKKFGCFGCFKS